MLNSTKLNTLRKYIKTTYYAIALLNLFFFIFIMVSSIRSGMHAYTDIAYIFLRLLNLGMWIISLILLIWDKRIFINNSESFALQIAFGMAASTELMLPSFK